MKAIVATLAIAVLTVLSIILMDSSLVMALIIWGAEAVLVLVLFYFENKRKSK